MPSFGEYLKRERELREISLREISDQTKISFRYLEALEEDNVSKLPAEVFIKGFIRSYVNHIGLDADEAILRYQEYQKTREITRGPAGPAATSRASDIQARQKMPVFWILLGLLMLGVLVLGYRYWGEKREGAVTEAPVQTAEEPIAEEPTVEEPTAAPSPPFEDNPSEVQEAPQATMPEPAPAIQVPKPPEKQAPSALSLDVTLYAIERTWLAFDVDDRQHYDVTLQVGEEIHFRMVDTLRLTVGNAGGLYVRHKSRTLGPLGESGQVVKNFVLTRKDLVGGLPNSEVLP